MQKTLKTIRIRPESYAQLEKMKQSLNRPIKLVVEELIQYAFKLRIDPARVKDGNPAAATEKLRKDLIAFMRTQENKMIKPMIETVDLSVGRLSSIADKVPSAELVIGHHKKNIVGFNRIIKELQEVNSSFNTVLTLQRAFNKEKETFKTLTIKYTDEFLQKREKYNSITQSKKIEELRVMYVSKIQNL